jgi:O-antigen/teichoic acid export membrane protein
LDGLVVVGGWRGLPLLNLALVPTYGGVGAAIAQCVSFAFIALGILAHAQTKFRVQLDWTRLIVTLLFVLAAGVLMARPWHGTAPISLLMKFPVGIGVAVIVAWVAAPDWCMTGADYLRRRVFH